ncbi:glycosyltransferase, partial [Neobacillus niacini]|uniref:glycosyltransferase n=1 Tax=Neobacillus niacini TaxID=86668 RepID=UPI002FFF764E
TRRSSEKKRKDPGRSLNNDQNIEVSVIIPSYNRYPLNLFSLYALENQTFPLSKMEVIFIDDASTDETEKRLKNYKPPYHFKYIRNMQNLGRSKVRNLGIQSSRGKILIFLDAEMISEPDFVKNHYEFHQSNQNAILSGVMHSKNVITYIFPETSKTTLTVLNTKSNTTVSKVLKNYQQSNHSPYPLLNKTDISNQTYKDLTVKTNGWFNVITQNFGEELKGFQFPWMAFLTGNVSFTRELIKNSGMFDEDFIKYGYEDWELGYRLYKKGAKFFVKDNLVTYHQEHPIGESKWKEAIENYNLFITKHPDVEVLILGIELARMTDLLTMNKMMQEYNQLVKKGTFRSFQTKFISILEAIALLLRVDIRHFNVLGAGGFGTTQKKELEKDIKALEKLKIYPTLTKFLNKIINS